MTLLSLQDSQSLMKSFSLERNKGRVGCNQTCISLISKRRQKNVVVALQFVLALFAIQSLQRIVVVLDEPSGYFIAEAEDQNKTSKTNDAINSVTSARNSWDSFWKDAIQSRPSKGLPNSDLTLDRLESINSSTSILGIKELYEIFPEPINSNTLEVYNQISYEQLLTSILDSNKQNRNDNNVTICINGGSSSAGAGNVHIEDRYFSKLSFLLKETHLGKNLNLIDRSHGNRDSLHSAIFADNFFPPDTDLLIWEFAINDGWKWGGQMESNHTQQYQSSLLAWLERVKQIQPHAPKVILVYLWPAFRMQYSQNISNPVFAAHHGIAKQFDFVIGHVNLISYLHELQFSAWEDSQVFYSSDWIHVNRVGHLAVSFLLLNLLKGQGRWVTNENIVTGSSPVKDSTTVRQQNYTWLCGNETNDQKFLQSLVTRNNNGSGWRSPIASWTLEIPQNESPKQLVPLTYFEVELLGKQNRFRQDRQGSMMLPCCNKHSESIATIGAPDHNSPISNAQAIFLGFGRIRKFDSLQVYINGERSGGRLLEVPKKDGNWLCKWNFDFYFSYWFLLTTEQEELSTIGLCAESSQCKGIDKYSDLMLVSLAVY